MKHPNNLIWDTAYWQYTNKETYLTGLECDAKGDIYLFVHTFSAQYLVRLKIGNENLDTHKRNINGVDLNLIGGEINKKIGRSIWGATDPREVIDWCLKRVYYKY